MKIPFANIVTEYIGFIVAFSANVCLIFLILTQTRQNLGSYRYLMLWFSLFSIWYAFIHFLTQPGMHSYKNSYIVFCASWFKYNKLFAPLILPTFCASFGLTLILFVIHFIYRYIAINKPSAIRFFVFPLALIWPTIFILVGIIWWCNVYFLLGGNDTIDEYMKCHIEEYYAENIKNLSYVGPLYYVISSDGTIELQYNSCIGMAIIYFIVTITLILITCLGIAICKKTRSNQTHVAPKTRELQRQLFHALTVQIVVPIIFMYTPVSILFTAPILGVELGSMANMTAMFSALYPALEPLVLLYFIGDYRKYILDCLKISFKPQGLPRNSL